MIQRNVEFIFDDQVSVGLNSNLYFVFAENGTLTPVSPSEVGIKYLEKGIKIPPQYTAVRQAVQALL